jgi:hypothetical protein
MHAHFRTGHRADRFHAWHLNSDPRWLFGGKL